MNHKDYNIINLEYKGTKGRGRYHISQAIAVHVTAGSSLLRGIAGLLPQFITAKMIR